ncbi:sMC domain protein [Clostridium sp. CAG:269]|jgi:putative ATP-dependent endonuclease of OLD family|nr:sMC domain protein [Clostridium sp. CAG:269]
MYLSELEIEGYRGIKERTKIKFKKGINLLVGDNRSGKSTVIDSVRLLLQENEYSREGIKENDFYHSIDDKEVADKIKISGRFDELSDEKKVEYITWLDEEFKALLNIEIHNKLDGRNNYKKNIWGGNSFNSAFEWDILNNIQCVYLPALRDAEKRLKNTRGSRLARLLLNLSEEERKDCKKNNRLTELENDVQEFNSSLSKNSDIGKARKLINESMNKSLGNMFSEKINIQFEEQSYSKIVENLKVMFYPENTEDENIIYRDLVENSLGYNNLIYIATILAEFEGLKQNFSTPRILLIEEIEAHLNPQIQIKLIKYLEKQAKENDIQVIITTHSPTIASSISLNNIICFNYVNGKIKITDLIDCKLNEKEVKFLDRWLDATKSTLLFSKGVLLVEGLAEALLIGKLASLYLKTRKYGVNSLEEAGISVINMNGIFFNYFFKLYDGYAPKVLTQEENETKKDFEDRQKKFIEKEKFDEEEFIKTDFIPIKCVALTDFDPNAEEKTTNPQLYRKKQVENMTLNCRVYNNTKTFEYEMALFTQNAKIMLEILDDYISTEGQIKQDIEKYLVDINRDNQLDNKKRAEFILDKIDTNWMGKGLFAQLLEEKIKEDNFEIPNYIKEAVDFLIKKEK